MSQDYKITVEVYCQWQADPKAYRIYINDDLLTERTYIWQNPQQVIQEIIIVNLAPGKNYFKIVSVDPEFNGFRYSLFKVNGELIKINRLTGEFTI